MQEARQRDLEKQGYRLVGNHSAVKICYWNKQALRGKDVCYKHTFYGINSWQCIEASVTLDICNLKCEWCWRDINTASEKGGGFNDEPKDIVDGFIKEHLKLLHGFHGNTNANLKRLKDSERPKHVALSLTGDACLYQRLPELIEEIHSREMTSFLVTNGTFPNMIRKLIDSPPAQLYITMPAPNEETFEIACKPITKNGWQRIQESLSLLKHFKRTVIRMTLAKKLNMFDPEGYAEALKDVDFKFLELKAAMPIGYARYRLDYTNMPSHQEIRAFSQEMCRLLNLKMIDEKENSRVTLLMREDNPDRIIKF